MMSDHYRYPPVDPATGEISADDNAILMGQMRHCDLPDKHRNPECVEIMHDHRWVDDGTELGLVLCPPFTTLGEAAPERVSAPGRAKLFG